MTRGARAGAADEAAPHRDLTLDVARGLAVLAMIWVHFVPEPEAAAVGWLAMLQRASVLGLDGWPAAMFLLLVGMGIVRGESNLLVVTRRAVALGGIGLALWWFVWPNDILVPIACCLPIVAALHRAGAKIVIVAVLTLFALVPIATVLFGEYAWSDVREDGTHEANHSFGWQTLRFFLFDGAYPLLPWLAFPLLGTLLERTRRGRRAGAALGAWLIAAMLAAVTAVAVDCLHGDEYAGGLAAHLAVTWQPTSLPFACLWGGAAIAVTAALALVLAQRSGRGGLVVLAALGRTSLSHYVAHLAIVYAGLRVWWPAEDWPTAVGVAAFVGYSTLAAIGSPLWLARGGRGPLEAVVARVATVRDQ
ncbi:MAG: heparan-alpha-glucosaminide N-acetyltransferase domain-containing protein [bacterium]|nr:heparan-alpha-glucosaminide N-acetyltransferase domain-containing protein [bacterium]